MVRDMKAIGAFEGVTRPRRWRDACRARAGSRRDGLVKPDDCVVLFNTGGALKYLDVLKMRMQ